MNPAEEALLENAPFLKHSLWEEEKENNNLQWSENKRVAGLHMCYGIYQIYWSFVIQDFVRKK